MSKIHLSTLLFLAFNLSLNAQTNYEVISILGNIVNRTKKDTLKEGSKYNSEAKLAFETEEDFIGVVDDDGNTFLVYLDPELDSIIYGSLLETIDRRRGDIINSIALIRHFAEHTQYLVMGSETHVNVSATAFPMNDHSFFYIRYLYNGSETINKQLPFDSTYFHLVQEDLFSAKYKKSELYGPNAVGDTVLRLDADLASNFEFRYYNSNKESKHNTFLDPDQPDDQKNRLFIPFSPRFLNHPSLVSEIQFLFQTIKKTKPDQDLKNHLLTVKKYIEDKYRGQVYLPNLESWMRQQGILE